MSCWAVQLRRSSSLTIKANLDVQPMSVHSGARKSCCGPCRSQLWARKYVAGLTWWTHFWVWPGERWHGDKISLTPEGALWTRTPRECVGQGVKGASLPPSDQTFHVSIGNVPGEEREFKWGYVSTKTFLFWQSSFIRKSPASSSAGLLCRRSVAWCQHHSYVPALAGSSILNTLTSPKATALPPENKPCAAGLPLIHSPPKGCSLLFPYAASFLLSLSSENSLKCIFLSFHWYLAHIKVREDCKYKKNPHLSNPHISLSTSPPPQTFSFTISLLVCFTSFLLIYILHELSCSFM